MTHYATLGVAENATADEIKKAYRSLASKHHPDKGGDTQKFQEIQAAYAVLEDPNKRAQYDNERRGNNGFRFTVNGQDMSHMPPGMEDIFGRFGFNFGDPFSHVRQHQQPRRNKDMRFDLHLNLADTLQPQKRIVNLKTTNGSEQTVEVDIPLGIHQNATIKYPGLGDNFFSTLPRGDLLVNILINPDPKFQISGYDLFTHIDISCLDAIIGCEHEFNTLDNKIFNLTVPLGTQAGTKFKIPAQGLYTSNQSQRGNLYLITNITVPTNLTSQQIEMIRQITTTK